MAFLLVPMMVMSSVCQQVFADESAEKESAAKVFYEPPEGWFSVMEGELAAEETDLLSGGEGPSLIYITCSYVYDNFSDPGVAPEDMDNDWLTREDVARMYPSVEWNLTSPFESEREEAVDVDAVSMKTYNGKEYYEVEYYEYGEPRVTALRLEDGYMFVFTLNQTLLDFEANRAFSALMDTVKYPLVDIMDYVREYLVFIVAGAAVLVILVVILAVSGKKKHKKKSKVANAARTEQLNEPAQIVLYSQTGGYGETTVLTQIQSEPAAEETTVLNPSQPEQVYVCPLCNAEIHVGESVCPKCGVPLSW